MGRLLIVFFLVLRERITEPLLYLSPFFEANRDDYYRHLQGVRLNGDFSGWLGFFLQGVATQSTDALIRAERLTDLRESYRVLVQQATRGLANRVVDLAFEQPVLNAEFVERRLETSRPSALKALRHLQEIGVLQPLNDGPRGQLRWLANDIMRTISDD